MTAASSLTRPASSRSLLRRICCAYEPTTVLAAGERVIGRVWWRGARVPEWITERAPHRRERGRRRHDGRLRKRYAH